MKWDNDFIDLEKPTIQFLELYALLAGVIAWIHQYKNKAVTIFCDNQNVCRMVTDNRSGCKNCMMMIRILVLHCLTLNIHLKAIYIESENNDMADPLSRGQMALFHKNLRKKGWEVDDTPTPVPEMLLPISKFWLK